ncbi:MAG: TAXI family TRAP transporter solute-binding subunit [Geminicoccaceae bacterium]
MNLLKTTLMASALLVGSLSLPAMAQDEDRSDWPASFTVGTASQGGTYFVYGSGWASMVSEALGMPGGGEVTGGPVQNATLVQTGDLEFAQVTMGPAADAWNGESELAPGVKHDKLRAIFPMYKTAFHAVTLANSGITDFASIPAGAKVGVGPQGGTPGTYWPRFMETLGIDIQPQYAGASDLAGQLQDGLVEVFAFAAGLPIPAFSQLDAQTDVRYLGFTEEQVAQITEAHPVAPFTIDGGLYPSMPDAQESVSMWNFAVTNADMPESFVYAVVDQVMSNHDRMMEIHKAASETLPENIDKNTFLPWHPGAVRWFEENGYTIPEDLKG